MPRAGALDRLGRDLSPVEGQKALGGERQDRRLRQTDKGGERRAVVRTQQAIGLPFAAAIGRAKTLGQVDLVTVSDRQMVLDLLETGGIGGLIQIRLPVTGQYKTGAGLYCLLLPPLPTCLPGGLVTKHQQMGLLRGVVEHPGPVIQADRHIRDLHIGTGECRQPLELTPQIVAPQAERPADKRQLAVVIAGRQVVMDRLLQCTERITGQRLCLSVPLQRSVIGMSGQGGARCGDDNIEPAIRVIRARRLEQHGPGQVLQRREQRTGRRISRQGQCAEMK